MYMFFSLSLWVFLGEIGGILGILELYLGLIICPFLGGDFGEVSEHVISDGWLAGKRMHATSGFDLLMGSR